MVIVLIHWLIRADDRFEQDFRDHWASQNVIHNREGFIAEFLSEPVAKKAYEWITWDFETEHNPPTKAFVTVGIWTDGKRFEQEIADYFNDSKPMLPFEAARRRRVMLTPAAYRIGPEKLPNADSDGVA